LGALLFGLFVSVWAFFTSIFVSHALPKNWGVFLTAMLVPLIGCFQFGGAAAIGAGIIHLVFRRFPLGVLHFSLIMAAVGAAAELAFLLWIRAGFQQTLDIQTAVYFASVAAATAALLSWRFSLRAKSQRTRGNSESSYEDAA
jgi:hypothetical protein